LDVVSVAEDLPLNLQLGDLLYSENIGAYTLASATNFNGMPLPKVVSLG
jgi:ornithine decarboxylase